MFEITYETLYKGKKPAQKIKENATDFIVEEITQERQLEINKYNGYIESDGPFLYFVIQKKNWAIDVLIKKIAKRLHISKKKFQFAGSKDKKALTVQLACLYAGKNRIHEQLLGLKIKDVEILECYYSDKPLKLGMLKGNRFTIKINDYSKEALEFLKQYNNTFPNYFGYQRFGHKRAITHIIGYYIIKGMFKEAVINYLTFTSNEENEGVKEARKTLYEQMDFKKALKYFPKHLTHERTLLGHLAKYQNDYVNALRKLPRQTLLMFVHAFQSFLFNKMLAKRVKELDFKKRDNEYYCKKDKDGFPIIEERCDNNKDHCFLCSPLIGYNTKINEEQKALLNEYNIKQSDFLIKSMPEISPKGAYRLILSPFINFKDLNNGYVQFTLPSGSYATVFLNEIIDII